MTQKHKDPRNADFLKLQASIELLYSKERVEKVKRREENLTDMQHYTSKFEEVKKTLNDKGIIMGSPVYELHRGYEGNVYVHPKTLETHWPVLFLYEEHHQSDWIRDFAESQTFLDHLSYMFPEGEHATWDVEKKYVFSQLEVYVRIGESTPLEPKLAERKVPSKWLRVRQETTLLKVLTHKDYVVPQFPVFYVAVKNSTFLHSLLNREGN